MNDDQKIIVITAYTLVTLVIAYLGLKKARTFNDYVLGGQAIGGIVSVATNPLISRFRQIRPSGRGGACPLDWRTGRFSRLLAKNGSAPPQQNG